MVLSALLLVVVALVPSVVALGTEPPPPRALAGVWGAAPWLDGDGVPSSGAGSRVAPPGGRPVSNDDFVNGRKLNDGRDRGAAVPPRTAEDFRGKGMFGYGGQTGPWDDHKDFRANDAALPVPMPLGYAYAARAPHALAAAAPDADGGVPEPTLLNKQHDIRIDHDAALLFDGVDDYAVVPPLDDDGAAVHLARRSFTVELWAKRLRGGRTEYFFSQGTGTPGHGVQFGVNAHQQLRFGFWGEGTETPGETRCTQGTFDPVSGAARACAFVPAAGGMDAREYNIVPGANDSPHWERATLAPSGGEPTGWTADASGKHTASCADTPRAFPEDVGAWVHYAATFDAETRVAHVYRNGVSELGERRPAGLRKRGDLVPCRKKSEYLGNGPVRIGRGVDSASSSDWYRGVLDEIRVWAGVALPRRVIATFAHFTHDTVLLHHPYRSYLAIFLDCNHGSRTAALAYDISNHEHTAQLVNGAEYVAGLSTLLVETSDTSMLTLELDQWRSTTSAASSEHHPTAERVADGTSTDPALYRYVPAGHIRQDPWVLLTTDDHAHRHPWLRHPSPPDVVAAAFYGLPGMGGGSATM